MSTNELRQLLGQSFLIGFAGLDLPPSVAKLIKENSIGGVTLFANNFESTAQVAELVNAIQDAGRQSALGRSLPMFIAVDHEGGKVQRFKKQFTHFPEARFLGDKDSPKLSYEVAAAQARELKAVGVNTTYAPVADINTNPKNPVIGRRSFGENEEIVSKMVSAQVRGYLTEGVQPVVKHFPGHGDTSQDSHLHLPKVNTDGATLRDRELKPFQKAFKSRCELVMTAHIIVESIDPGVPATLSKKILQDILRGELRYKGLILSDDMEMKAMTDHFGAVEAPLKALEAGCDLLLYHTEPAETAAFEGLLTKLTAPEGKTARAMLESSFARIQDYKRRHFLPYNPIKIGELESSPIGSKEHAELLKTLMA